MTGTATLLSNVNGLFSGRALRIAQEGTDVCVHVPASDYLSVMRELKENSSLSFDQLIDLCGIDYGPYAGKKEFANRFCIAVHLRSLEKNTLIRVMVYADSDETPVIDSVVSLWPAADWFEREAFDLYGILFKGHPDMRRLLTDYGFVGHPLRKDFPIEGHVQVRYDDEKKSVVNEPVDIEVRLDIPRTFPKGGAHG